MMWLTADSGCSNGQVAVLLFGALLFVVMKALEFRRSRRIRKERGQ